MQDSITYTVAADVARIGLNRPPVNALTSDLIKGVIAALHHARKDGDAKVVLICSDVAERFSAGLDLSELRGASADDVRGLLMDLYLGLHDAQRELSKPSIALVNGTARGGGMTIAISCDMILAAEDADLGYPEINLALPPAIHFAHLPPIVGRHKAFELLLTGRTFSAEEACSIGLVNRVVKRGDLESEGMALAATLIAKPQVGLQAARAAFYEQASQGYRAQVAKAVEDFCCAYDQPEVRAGIEAFLDRKG